jgi:hypothetical protein
MTSPGFRYLDFLMDCSLAGSMLSHAAGNSSAHLARIVSTFAIPARNVFPLAALPRSEGVKGAPLRVFAVISLDAPPYDPGGDNG